MGGRKQSRGTCPYCGTTYARNGMVRHLTVCKKRQEKIENKNSVKTCDYLTFLITGKYEKDYWLIVECKETTTLQEVDQFLRDIWLECCGHLSAFSISGRTYESYTDPVFSWGKPSQGMNVPLKDVFYKGMTIDYVYDFGSSTNLTITASDRREGPERKEKLALLIRNQPVEFICSACEEKAVAICTECGDLLCEDCRKTHDCDEEMQLPVCNSPRWGVCGYEGSKIYGD